MRKYQYYNTGDDNDRDIYGVNRGAQSFTPTIDHLIGSVKLKLFRVGDPETITVSIKATTAGKPVGADLCSGTIEGTEITLNAAGEWYEIPLGGGFSLEKDVKYAIAVKAPDGDASNKVSWRADITSPTYTGGTYCASTDSGVSWSTYSGVDCMFEEWGVGPPSATAVVWGNLPKSQISNEKIEAAIARIIQDHEDDPNAHLETGESLESHKASVIIDHIVNSIITDKIESGAITREKLDPTAVTFVDEDFDKGFVIDFLNFTSSITGSASIEKVVRSSEIDTGATQNSVGKIYAQVCQAGNLWYCTYNLEIAFHYYIGEEWGWEVAPGGEVYIKYGMGTNADMGANTDKVFGIKFEDLASGKVKATAFARDRTSLATLVLAEDLVMTVDYIFTIKKIGSYFYFYIDGVAKGNFYRNIPGAVGDPLLTHVAKNPIANSRANGILNSMGYYFPF